MRQAIYTILILVVLPLFNNMDLVSADFVSLHEIDEEVRSSHAKELLGRSFQESVASPTRDMSALNQKIYQQFLKQLPEDYQDQAMDYANIVIEESLKQNIDPVLTMAVISVESRFNPKARGSVGEMGLMQLRPETAAWIAKKTGHSYRGGESLYMPEVNIALGVRYIAFLRKSFRGQGVNYIAAYNMGAANVRKLLAQDTSPKVYSAKILANYKGFYEVYVLGEEISSSTTWSVAGN